MKLYLDTNAIAYLCNYSQYKSKDDRILNIKEYQKHLNNSELITDYISIFEIFNKWQNNKNKLFETLKNFDSTFFTPGIKKADKISQAFRVARDTKQFDVFFKKITSVVAKQYARELSRIMWHLLGHWIGEIFYYNTNENEDEYRLLLQKIKSPLKNIELHTRKIFHKNIVDFVDKNCLNQDNIKMLFDLVIDTTAYYINKIQFVKYNKTFLLKSFIDVLGDIAKENYLVKKTCDYLNQNRYDNYFAEKAKTRTRLKKDKEYILNAIKTDEYTDIIRNKLLNQIAIRQNINVDFNDIKDALIATNYLDYTKEYSDKQEVYFVTLDNKFIKKLKTCNDINYQKSINFIDSLFESVDKK